MNDQSVLDAMPEVVFVKVHPAARLPQKNHESDTGFDLFGIEDVVVPARGSAIVPTGIDVGYIPPGYWFQIAGRSGLGFKHSLEPHPGTVDNEYRGNLGVKIFNFSDTEYQFKAGDKIAQIIFFLNLDIKVKWGEKVPAVRGEKGFGSSGR